MRWRYLLRPEGQHLPFAALWHATAIGFMANNVLPARAGEIARVYAASRLTSARFSSALASVAVERAMDGIVLVGLMAVAIAGGDFVEGSAIGGVSLVEIATLAAGVFAFALLCALILVHWPEPALRFAQRLFARVLSESWTHRALGILEGALVGLESLRNPALFARVAFWSLAVWGTGAASFWACLVAFDIDVSWRAALLLQALIAFGVTVIPAAPGFFGTFEAATRATLALFGVAEIQSVSYAITYHIGGFIPITVLGLWSLSRAHLHLAELRSNGEKGTGSGTHGREAALRGSGRRE